MFQVEVIGPGFVAAIEGLDLGKALASDVVAELKRTASEHGVLVFRGQHLSISAQIAFAGRFGSLDTETQRLMHDLAPPRIGNVELLDVSNLDVDGSVAGRNHRQRLITLGNMMWHCDGTMREHANRYSMLFAAVVPSWGGNTEFADLRAAYDALDGQTCLLIKPMVAGHTLNWSRDIIGLSGGGYPHRRLKAAWRWLLRSPMSLLSYTPRRSKAAWRPLVDVHPESGRKVLHASIYAAEIAGMPIGEARLLLLELLEHATQKPFVYSHAWTAGDVLLFDNRSVAHRLRRFDLTARRELTRAATMETVPALLVGETYAASV